MNDASTVFFDLETTGLLAAGAPSVLTGQPHIIELCFSRGDETFHTLVKPPIGISEEIRKITGIDESMMTEQSPPTFARIYPELARFCLGAERWVAHNIAFDSKVLAVELTRMEKQLQFPWPMGYSCTLEQARRMDLGVNNNKLGTLYTAATGKTLEGAHRADVDVAALKEVYNWLRVKMESSNG